MSFELYNAKASVKKYFLERFENFGNREMIAVEEQISDGTLTIEHIMPQTLKRGENRESRPLYFGKCQGGVLVRAGSMHLLPSIRYIEHGNRVKAYCLSDIGICR